MNVVFDSSHTSFAPLKRSGSVGWGVCCGNALSRYQRQTQHCTGEKAIWQTSTLHFKHRSTESMKIDLWWCCSIEFPLSFCCILKLFLLNSRVSVAQVSIWYLKKYKWLKIEAESRLLKNMSAFDGKEWYRKDTFEIHRINDNVKYPHSSRKKCCCQKKLYFQRSEQKFATMWHESRSEEKKMAGLMADR